MPEQNENLPKVPPFVIKGNGGNAAQGPVNPPPPLHRTPAKKNGQPSERGMLSLVVLLISLIGLGVAMLSGSKFSYDILFYT